MSRLNISFCAILTLFFMVLTTSCNKKISGYELSGKLENMTGDYFYMTHESGDSILIDTVRVNEKGEFSFKSDIDTLTVMSLYFNKNTKSTFVLVNKGWAVNLEGNVLYPDLIDIKGGNVNEDLTLFKNNNKDLLKSRADILNNAEEGGADNDSLKTKDYMVDLKNINFELSNIAAAYIKANPDKIASVMLINTFFKDDLSIPRLDENLSLLKGKAADFPLTIELRNFSDKIKSSSVGAYAPNFTLKDMKGKDVRLSDFRGKYLLLSFVATTCNVCIDEKKDAVTVYNELKKLKKNIEFVTIVKDIEQNPIPKNISDSVKWNILPVEGGWSAKEFDSYYIREIPYHILVSPTGVIVERNLSLQDLIEKLNRLPDNEQKTSKK